MGDSDLEPRLKNATIWFNSEEKQVLFNSILNVKIHKIRYNLEDQEKNHQY